MKLHLLQRVRAMGILRMGIGRRRGISFLGVGDGNVARRKEMEEWDKNEEEKRKHG